MSKNILKKTQNDIHKALLSWISNKSSIIEQGGLDVYNETYIRLNKIIDDLDVLIVKG